MSEVVVAKDERLTQRSPQTRVARVTSADDPEGLEIRVIDAGPGGLRAISPVALARGTRVRCVVETDDGPLPAEGVIAWQLTEGDDIHVGLRFTFVDPELSLWLAEEVRAHRRAQIGAAPASGPAWQPEPEPEPSVEEPAADEPPPVALEPRPTIPDPEPPSDLDRLISEELGPLGDEIVAAPAPEPALPAAMQDDDWDPRAEAMAATPEVEEPVEPVLQIEETRPPIRIAFDEPVAEAEPVEPEPAAPRKSHRAPRALRPAVRFREQDVTVVTKIESSEPLRGDPTPPAPRERPQATVAPTQSPAIARQDGSITIRLPNLRMPKVSVRSIRPILGALAQAGAWTVDRVKHMRFWSKLERRNPRMHRWARRRVPLLLATAAVGFLVGSALLVLALRDDGAPHEGTAASGAESYWDLPVAAVAVERGTPPLPAEAAGLPRSSAPRASASAPAPAAPVQAAAALPALPPVAPPEEEVEAIGATSPTAEEVGDIEAEGPAAEESPFPGAPALRLRLSGSPEGVNHYPLANPNGIVIDVPGRHHPGSSERLEPDHPLVRFIKIIERDDGVRFIVYLQGPMPPYEIVPSDRALRIRFPGHAVEE